jgi:hypothetical protein
LKFLALFAAAVAAGDHEKATANVQILKTISAQFATRPACSGFRQTAVKV